MFKFLKMSTKPSAQSETEVQTVMETMAAAPVSAPEESRQITARVESEAAAQPIPARETRDPQAAAAIAPDGEPAPQNEVAAVPSEVPAPQNEEAVTHSEVPAPQNEETATSSEVPAPQNEEAATPSEAPAPQNEAAVTPSEVPAAQNEEAVTPSEVPAPQNEEAATSSEVPAPQNEEAAVPSEVPAPQNEEAATQSDTETAQEPASPDEAEDPPAATIEEYIRSHGFEVDYKRSHEYGLVVEPVRVLAYFIGDHFDHLSDFLGYLKIRLGMDGFVSYSMSRLSEAEKTTTVKLATKLASYGLLSNMFVNSRTGIITGQLVGTKRIYSFLTGGWLEIYARYIAEKTVAKRAKELGVGYQVCSNLLITKEAMVHELDVVFKLDNGRMCWVECKSSSKFNDFNAIYQVGVDLATIPTYTLLLYPGTQDSVVANRYFFDIYCSRINTAQFTDQLNEMLTQSIMP